jgi:hypothetical protein
MNKTMPQKLSILCFFLSMTVFQTVTAQSVRQKGACGAIYVRMNEASKKVEIEQLPVVLQSHKTLDRDRLLTFDSAAEIEDFIKLLQTCGPEKNETESPRFECLYLKDTKVISFGHAEDKYTTKDVLINYSDVSKLVKALQEIKK